MENIDINRLHAELKPEDIRFLPKQTMKYGDNCYCVLIPYKTARVDMDRLDDACGIYWQNEYKRDSNGILQCGIGIYFKELGDWVWRWSNGVPSQFEKEKGEYSDAFKRAGFMWNIGRELYSYPKIRITLNEKEYAINDKGEVKLTPFFLRQLAEDWVWQIKKTESGKYWLVGSQWYGQKKVVRYDSNPLESKNPRN